MDFLVIDDDKVFREATCLLIEDEGHYAEGAGRADLALQRLREEKFDAALLDLHLGRDDGLAILPQLLKIHTFFRIDERSKFEAQKRLIFSFVYDDGFGRGFRLHRSLNLEM